MPQRMVKETGKNVVHRIRRCGASLVTSALLAVGLCVLAGCGASGNAENTADPVAKINPASNPEKTDSSSEETSATKPDPKRPQVVLDTSMGRIVVRLNAEAAPLTVDNFLVYVDEGHYNGTVFHQVVQNYVILGGGYSEEMKEKPTHTPVRNEAHNGLSNKRGTIAMARGDSVDSSTSQFFFNLDDNGSLDHVDRTAAKYGYCVFGEVVEGMDVLDKISTVPVHDVNPFESVPVKTVAIRSAKRLK